MPKRSTSKQPDPVVYFTDRDLGSAVARTLRASGMHIEAHDDHFPGVVPDDSEWLSLCGARRWVGLSKDKAIQWNELAVTAVMTHRARLFICIGRYPHPQIAENIVNSRHRLDRIARKHDEAFIARLYMAPDRDRARGKAGEVRLWRTYDEWRKRT